ncbi:MAG TPA: hypothetical protein ENN43_00315 [bacterium]|nr:hypothetical protein [bacterium]
MHFTVSWDIEAEGESLNRIHNLLLENVKKHSLTTAEPLSKYIIAGIENEAKWHIILKSLKGIALMHKGRIKFVMSPPMKGGQYNGELKDWIKVNEAAK